MTLIILSNAALNGLKLYRKFEVSYNGGAYKTIYDGDKSSTDWKPGKAGKYDIRYTLYDENGISDSRVYSVEVK